MSLLAARIELGPQEWNACTLPSWARWISLTVMYSFNSQGAHSSFTQYTYLNTKVHFQIPNHSSLIAQIQLHYIANFQSSWWPPHLSTLTNTTSTAATVPHYLCNLHCPPVHHNPIPLFLVKFKKKVTGFYIINCNLTMINYQWLWSWLIDYHVNLILLLCNFLLWLII